MSAATVLYALHASDKVVVIIFDLPAYGGSLIRPDAVRRHLAARFNAHNCQTKCLWDSPLHILPPDSHLGHPALVTTIKKIARCLAGYMVARMLGAAPVLSDSIIEQLCRNSDRAVDSHKPLGAASEEEADHLAGNVWRAIWPVERCIVCAAP